MKEVQKIKNELTDKSVKQDISVGDIFIKYRDNEVIRIYEREKGKYKNYRYEWLSDVFEKEWIIDKGEYSDTGKEFFRTKNEEELFEYYEKITADQLDLWIKQADAFLTTGQLTGFDQAEDKSLNSETALVGTANKEYLVTIKGGLEEKKSQLDGMNKILDMRLAEQKRKMELMRKQINNKLAVFKKQIKHLMRIITTIELYLGIEEELHQIQEGATADLSEPITFRQQVLYMDEETAIIDGGGLDWTQIDKFDEWLLKDKNYEKIFPEKRGVICLKPRRNKKDYGNIYRNATENVNNLFDSYFLIRNGENIYRIFTEKLVVGERLFPKRSELKDMLDHMDETVKKTSWEDDKQKAKDKVEDTIYGYRKLAFFYQGLIDRTNVFHPFKQGISVFKMEECQESFNFIYDDELTLGDGRLPFFKWKAKINSKIVRGSRIVISDTDHDMYGGYISRKEYANRLFYYCNERSVPNTPNKGLYQVDMKYLIKEKNFPHYYIDELESKGLLLEKGTVLQEAFCEGYGLNSDMHEYMPIDDSVKIKIFKGKSGHNYVESYNCKYKHENFFIKYNPGGEVYGSWGNYDPHDRKNRISWKIYKNDDFVFNYDLIDTESIDFYLNSRVDRKNYYMMIPLLLELKKNRAEELKWEKSFVRMVVENSIRKIGKKVNDEKCEDFVWNCIEWWKNKVIMKRPITKDDTLALRMIEKKVLSESNRSKILN